MEMGDKISDSTAGPFPIQKRDCTHPERMLKPRAGGGSKWFTCLGCGTRWARGPSSGGQRCPCPLAETAGEVVRTPPSCPRCQSPMELRSHSEMKFWGCTMYGHSECRMTLSCFQLPPYQLRQTGTNIRIPAPVEPVAMEAEAAALPGASSGPMHYPLTARVEGSPSSTEGWEHIGQEEAPPEIPVDQGPALLQHYHLMLTQGFNQEQAVGAMAMQWQVAPMALRQVLVEAHEHNQLLAMQESEAVADAAREAARETAAARQDDM